MVCCAYRFVCSTMFSNMLSLKRSLNISDGSQPTINAGPVVDVKGSIRMDDSDELHSYRLLLSAVTPSVTSIASLCRL